ncbi:hypothetical protein Ccrd_025373 [Cynara cardunculus var. scolymus]|uniref:Uncharacterized protein n=1 Tax=Cynara cardunculus var. scolymus TaxID=59895 RepID=A0A103XAZ3_CYNCS|nr:hypothetical protein Ccrd_025373 [Cynara cardunculus var. scolymus]
MSKYEKLKSVTEIVAMKAMQQGMMLMKFPLNWYSSNNKNSSCPINVNTSAAPNKKYCGICQRILIGTGVFWSIKPSDVAISRRFVSTKAAVDMQRTERKRPMPIRCSSVRVQQLYRDTYDKKKSKGNYLCKSAFQQQPFLFMATHQATGRLTYATSSFSSPRNLSSKEEEKRWIKDKTTKGL